MTVTGAGGGHDQCLAEVQAFSPRLRQADHRPARPRRRKTSGSHQGHPAVRPGIRETQRPFFAGDLQPARHRKLQSDDGDLRRRCPPSPRRRPRRDRPRPITAPCNTPLTAPEAVFFHGLPVHFFKGHLVVGSDSRTDPVELGHEVGPVARQEHHGGH